MIMYEWDGLAMMPLTRFAKLCDSEFVVGEKYHLEVKEERSWASHRQYFAAVRDYWETLPELIADQHQTDEHLRKWALIKCGYCDERSIVASSKAEAQRIAAFIKPMDDFAVVVVSGAVVQVFTAKSQSRKAMGSKVFQQSKSDVLDLLESIVGAKSDVAA